MLLLAIYIPIFGWPLKELEGEVLKGQPSKVLPVLPERR